MIQWGCLGHLPRHAGVLPISSRCRLYRMLHTPLPSDPAPPKLEAAAGAVHPEPPAPLRPARPSRPKCDGASGRQLNNAWMRAPPSSAPPNARSHRQRGCHGQPNEGERELHTNGRRDFAWEPTVQHKLLRHRDSVLSLSLGP